MNFRETRHWWYTIFVIRLLMHVMTFKVPEKAEFYLDDIRGSKTGLIDNTAGRIVSYWYNDFGEVSEEREEGYEDFTNELQYTGAIYDSSTGLLYLNARF